MSPYAEPRCCRPRKLQGERHLPTMTVEETFKFAFDSMSGGTHLLGRENLSIEQKTLVEWMDERYFKVRAYRIYLSLMPCRIKMQRTQ